MQTSTEFLQPIPSAFPGRTAKEVDADEDLLREDKSRYVMFPVQYEDIWMMYKKAVASYWTAEEINFSQDLEDLDKMTEQEKFFINHVLAFFAASDGIVMENIDLRFSEDIKIPEARAFYAFQNAIESVHSETYSLLIDTYVKDTNEKDKLFNAITNFEAIRNKANWALSWVAADDITFAQRLVAFVIVEGLFFSASFCAIFWLKQRGLVPGLTFSNKLIARDETLHTEFGCLLYSKLKNRLTKETVNAMLQEAVTIEKDFITRALPCSLLGMNSDAMITYIQYVADRLLLQLGYEKIFHSTNPFPFMESSAMQVTENFFETRVSAYSKAGITLDGGKSVIPDKFSINLNDDF